MKSIQIILKNISQVLLINNHYTGLFILIALFVGNWKVGISALIGSIIAYILAPYINYSQEEIDNQEIEKIIDNTINKIDQQGSEQKNNGNTQSPPRNNTQGGGNNNSSGGDNGDE